MKRFIGTFYTVFLTLLMFFASVTVKAEDVLDDGLNNIDISLLTCEPHEEVYSLYGHTAIRINNKATGQDLAVNYGVFDQTKPYFVLRFIFGLTDYTMEIFPMEYFLREYSYYGSAVREQVLNLTSEEKVRILHAIEKNYQPANKVYRYNFFYNNCTTKTRNIILENLNGKIEYGIEGKQKGKLSFRELIHWKTEGYPWATEGNDLLLGVGSDLNTTFDEREFIPEVLMTDWDNATIVSSTGEKRKLIAESSMLLNKGTSMAGEMSSFPLSPLGCAFLILCLTIALTAYERIVRKRRIEWVDKVLFTLFGLVGLILLAMVFSEHPTVRVNLQILLFCPAFLALPWWFGKGKRAAIISLFIILAFLLGNCIQDYADGTNILALSLLGRLANIIYDKK